MLWKGSYKIKMSYYLDQIAKINYYKARIIENFAQNGMYPNNIDIENKINDINTSLAIFEYIDNKEGEIFDINKFNQDLKAIYDDLLILYKLVYQESIKEYEKIKIYVENNLSQLERLSNSYKYKTKMELDSTSLGNTIFFQGNGFNIVNKNGVAIINLGKIEVNNASKIACLFDADNIKDEQVVFSFDGNNCSPYTYNKDFFIVPGKIEKTSYIYTLPENIIKNTMYEMIPDNFSLNTDNKYIIYGGKNEISTVLGDNKTFYNKIDNIGINLLGAGKIIFYILNGSFVNFDFSSKPVNTNFSGTSIDNLNDEQEIIIEYYGDFSFNFETDGSFYATKANGLISNNKLYYPDNDDLNSFYIEEYKLSNKTTYNNVTVTISDLLTDNPLNINAIAIKELSALDGIAV